MDYNPTLYLLPVWDRVFPATPTMTSLVQKAGTKLFEKHIQQYAPVDPLYETYTDKKGRTKRRKVITSLTITETTQPYPREMFLSVFPRGMLPSSDQSTNALITLIKG
jgi:hypothetical protein